MNDYISESISKKLHRINNSLPKKYRPIVQGKITRMVGMTLEATGCMVPMGSICQVINHDGEVIHAEVVGFSEEKLYLMPIDKIYSLQPGAKVLPLFQTANCPVGDELLGRIINGRGEPLDNKGPLDCSQKRGLYGKTINPLRRSVIREGLDVGVRAINGLLTIGRGQRIGLFAGSGVGKSVLLSMMARYTEADVIIVGLIGERGREVREFIEENLGHHGLARCVVVASPADESPLIRMHASYLATTIAEYFRDQGKHVLLLMDSLTRFAQAQREIALSIGELPATKGYTPSVFSKLPALVERAGTTEHGKGTITAFYTVLVEGDDQQDPIADAARAILDGHIVLSRRLADSGHYPAIDLESSISRVMVNVTGKEQQKLALLLKRLYGTYSEQRDLIQVGAYQKGSDPILDLAIKMMPTINAYLQQPMDHSVSLQQSIDELQKVLTEAAS